VSLSDRSKAVLDVGLVKTTKVCLVRGRLLLYLTLNSGKGTVSLFDKVPGGSTTGLSGLREGSEYFQGKTKLKSTTKKTPR